MSEQVTYIQMTREELADFGENIVHNTLVSLKLKPSRLSSGRIYRQDMIAIIGERRFEKARREGYLPTQKDGPRNSKVWSRREDWERFLAMHVNQKL